MKSTKYLKIAGMALGGLSLASTAFALDADTSARLNARSLGTSASSTVRAQAKMTKVQERDYIEIQNRIDRLNKLSSRISEMKRVSAEVKANVSSLVSAQISSLTALKAKIGSDTDATTLKTDSQSITKAYRIYALVMPQTAIVAAIDRIDTIVGLMNTLVTKLETRIGEAKTAGKDTTAMETSIADMKAKIADASVQASAAQSAVVGLKPDNGDTTIATSNKAALLAAREKLKAARADLEAARKDAKSIALALKASGMATTTSAVLK